VSQQSTNHSFDELARALASGSLSRGKALRLMGGLLVGSALASLPGVAWADDDDDERCRSTQTRCKDRCVNLRTNERHCGRCFNRCTSNQTCCGGRCVNLKRNERHCGRCGKSCEEGQECVDGVCQGGGCPDSQICGDSCCTAGETCYGPFLTNAEPVCCSNDPLCQGNPTAAGTIVCVNLQVVGGPCPRPTCNTDADCSGEICIQTPGCPGGGNRCAPAC
jgi:hypothetical protein